jgi:hypothetical protein
MVDRMSELFGYPNNDNLIPKKSESKKGGKPNNSAIKSMNYKTNSAIENKVGISAKELSKSDKARSEGNISVKKFRNYYDINNTITTSLSFDPQNEDNIGYNRERIFEILERNSDIVHVANDGIDTLFAIVFHEGGQNSANERPIYPGDVKDFYDVYEIRLRSATKGLPYRVTEYDIETFPLTYLTTQPLNIRPLNCEDRISICAPYSPIVDYNFTQDLETGSFDTYNYVAMGNFKLSSIEVSASGAVKVEVKSGNIGYETTKMISFTSPSNPTIQLRFYESVQLIWGQRLQVIITNRELQSMDCNSTIIGFNS